MSIVPDRITGFFQTVLFSGCRTALHNAGSAGLRFWGNLLPGKLGGFFECAAEYGLRYAVRRTMEKFYRQVLRSYLKHCPQDSQPLCISFVLPVQNAQSHLAGCLHALQSQTLPHIEIIAIDGGSSDDSLAILNQCAASDPRIRVFSSTAADAGSVRNAGLFHAAGEYVVFLDPSDIVSRDMAMEVYLCAKINRADTVIWRDAAASSDVPSRIRLHPAPQKQPFCHSDCPDHLFQITSVSLRTKAFRRKFLLSSGLTFQPHDGSDDISFVYSAMAMSAGIMALETPLVSCGGSPCRISPDPLSFYAANAALHDRLEALGILDTLRQTYVNAALSRCLQGLNAICVPETKEQVRDMLRTHGFAQLGILDLDRACYFEQDNYLQALRIMDPAKSGDTSLSILIPVYNVEKYLADCLDSVLQCKDQNLEIICVNDASTDRSLEILESYARKDHRIKIINKEKNEGLLHARKSGVDAASNGHIMFLDSDDYVTAALFEFAENVLLFEPADIIQFSTGVEDHSGDIRNIAWLTRALRPANTCYLDSAVLEQAYVQRSYVTTLWGKIFKTDLCKKAYAMLPDQRCYVGEDILTYFFLAFFARSYVGLDTPDYYIYRYGLGVSNNDTMALGKFDGYCQMAVWASYIRDTLITESSPETSVRACESAAIRMYEDCLRICQTQIAEADLDMAVEMLRRYWKDFPFANQMAQDILGVSLV